MISRIAILAGITATLASASYDEAKSSPIGHKRSHAIASTTIAPLPSQPAPVGGDTGIACFFRPKVTLDADGLPVEPPPSGFTAAHPTYPLGTRVKVTNLGNHKSVVVKITERRIPNERIISLSLAAAEELGFVRAGTAQVHLEKVN